MKYDGWRSDNAMLLRALTAAVIVLVSSVAEAQWHAAVVPPRAELPAVTVDFGYPGPYVPSSSAPITLHATAGDIPFDGYIGFELRAAHIVHDTPVIARAVLRPHQAWTFTTFAHVRQFGNVNPIPYPTMRFVVVDWLDRSVREVASASAGTPPWTTLEMPRQPLRITRGAALSDRAQWYAGFSKVIVPVDVWLDLPRRVREVIFGSGIQLVFFGVPRAEQQLDDLDRALLPVTFGMHVVAKSHTDKFGAAEAPSIVRSGAAAWCADEATAARPLPRTTAPPALRDAWFNANGANRRPSVAWPRPSQIARLYPAALTSLAAIAVTIAGWIVLRKRQRAIIPIALVAVAAIPLAVRARIRPPAGAYRVDLAWPVADGIVDTLKARHEYGSSTLAEPADDAERMRTSVTEATEADETRQSFDLRTSDTPMAMGTLSQPDWNAITRWSRRREIGDGPRIRIRHRDANALVLDFDSRFPVNYVGASWLCGDTFCNGSRLVRRAMSGSVTIEAGHQAWHEDEPFAIAVPYAGLSTAYVALIDRSASMTREFRWNEEIRP